MIDRGETSSDLGRELMRKTMKSYLAPVAAVLFRAGYTRVPRRVYLLWNPQALAVADRPCCYARLTPPAPSPAVAASSLYLRVYIVLGRGNPPRGSRIRCGCGTSRRFEQLPKESRGPALNASLLRTECVLN